MELSETAAFERLKGFLEKNEVVCPVCKNNDFRLVPGYINHPLQKDIFHYSLQQGPMIPTITVACSRCGYLFQHVVGTLDPDAYKKSGG